MNEECIKQLSANELKELEDAYNNLTNAANKLIKVSANAENDELSLMLSKITTQVLHAKYKLFDDVLAHFEVEEDE